MKKLAIGILSGAIILGAAGTYAFAQENGDGEGPLNFGQMKPYIEKMHPDLSTKEQKEMFDACHGEGGMMENNSTENMKPENMMNNF